MYLLQAAWEREGRLLLWAERGTASPDAAQSSPPADGGQSETGSADSAQEGIPSHPNALSESELRSIFAELELEGLHPASLILELPTRKGAPLVSPQLRTADGRLPRAEEGSPLTWGRWNVPALSASPLTAVYVLSSLPEALPADSFGTAGRSDGSVLYWREATKLLLELLAKGAFLPGLLGAGEGWRTGDGIQARWLPILGAAAENEKIATLIRSMPEICRSIVDWGVETLPEPELLLRSFLEQGADALVRSFLARSNLVPDLDARRLSLRAAPALAWLRALVAREGEIGTEPDMRQLELQLGAWSGRLVKERPKYSMKTFFIIEPPDPRLIEKGEGNADALHALPWRVTFGVDLVARKRFRLDARRVWRHEIPLDESLVVASEEVEQYLIASLGRAAPVFPPLHDAIDRPFPGEVELTTEDAYEFLREIAPRLEELGFSVELPAWWREQESNVGLKLEVDSDRVPQGVRPGFGLLASTELLEFTWTVAVGDETLSLDEFYDLAKSRAPLVPVRGKWVELNPKRVEATMAFLAGETPRKGKRFVDLLRLGLGVETFDDALPIVSFTAHGWLGRLLNAESHSVDLVQETEGFQGTLRPYQREGLSWLRFLSTLGIGACLADDMGLGKTVQLLALLLLERVPRDNVTGDGRTTVDDLRLAERASDGRYPTLLIVPMSIVANWEREAARFAPTLRVYVHHGAQRLSGEPFRKAASASDLVITTYSLAFRDEMLLSSVKWGRITLDEAQNIKNRETKQTKAIRRLAHRQMTADHGCERIALTGTPLENHLEELWSIFDFLNPGFLGSVQDFRERFAVPIERYRDKDAGARLGRVLHPFILRRLKTDPRIVGDLPEKLEMDVVLSLTKEQALLYQSVLDDMLPQVSSAGGMHRKGLVLATITKLKQICDHPALFLRDGEQLEGRSHKVTHLEQLLETLLAEGDKTLVFTQFVQMGMMLKPYLERRFGVDVLFLHGGLSRKAREDLVQQFQTKAGPPIFILSLRAGGFGLNLTEANQVIHLDQWWNPAVEEQATDRVHRIGQERTVQVRRLICKGTLEERINELLQRKRELVDQVVGTTKGFVTQLSNDELRELLQLTPR